MFNLSTIKQLWNNWEVCFDSYIDLVHVHCTKLTNILILSKYQPNKLNGEFTYALKRLLCDPLPWHLIYGHHLMSLLPLDQRHHVGEVWARLEQGESRYAPDKYFSYNSFLTFTFDIKNVFNVIKHTLLESSVYVKYGPKILNGQFAFFEKRDVYGLRFDFDPWTTISI